MRQKLSAGRPMVWLMTIFTMAIIATVIVSSGCGTSRTNVAAAPGKQTVDEGPVKAEIEIRIENFVFVPAGTTIAPGTRVTWVNKDDAPHTATSTDDRFNSEGLDTDDKFSFVFREKGDFPYYCALHPHMKGVIKVQ